MDPPAPPFDAALFDALPHPTFVLDAAGVPTHWNAAATEVLSGRPPAATPFWDVACADDDAVGRAAARAAFERRPATAEADLPGGRGTYAWTFRPIGSTPGDDAGGGGVVCAGTDVTERRRLDRELAAAHEKLRALVEHSPDYVAFNDLDLRYTWVSRTVPPMTPEMLIGLRDADFVPPEDVGWLEAMRRRVIATGVPERNEMGFKVPGGGYHRFESVIQRRTDAAGNVLGTAAYTRDITDRWRAEQALRKANETLERRVAERTAAAEQLAEDARRSERLMREGEERHRLLFELSPLALQVVGRDGRLVRVNRAWERLWGVTLADIPGHNLLSDPRLEANGVIPLLRRAFAGETVHIDPVPFVPDVGAFTDDARWVRTIAYPATVGGGPVEQIVLIQEDVTEPIRARDAVRVRTALLEAVGEAAIDGILAVSAAGEVLWSNSRFAEMWCLPEAVIAGGSDAAALAAVRPHLADPEGFARRVADLYDHPDARARDEVPLKDGRVFDRYTAPIATDGREGRVWFFRDITSRRRDEERLRQSERHHRDLAERNSWLAREVEHRVGNHLAGLVGLVSLMRARSANVDEFAAAIEARLRGMAEVHRLLTAGGRDPVDLRTLVSTALEATRCLTAHEPTETVDGPDVAVSAGRAVPLMMVLVEWYTNSCKYGAHTVPDGTLAVTWAVAGDGDGRRVRLRWREAGVPDVRRPPRQSIGMVLVQELTARELAGTVKMTLGPDGADHVLEFPAE